MSDKWKAKKEFINLQTPHEWLTDLVKLKDGSMSGEEMLSFLMAVAESVKLKPSFRGDGFELQIMGERDTVNEKHILVCAGKDIRSALCVAFYALNNDYAKTDWSDVTDTFSIPF